MQRDLTASRTAVLRMAIRVLESDSRVLGVSLRQEADQTYGPLGPYAWETTADGIVYRLMCGRRTESGGSFGGFTNAAAVWHTERLLALGERNETLYDDEPQMMIRTAEAGLCSAQLRLNAACASTSCNYAFIHAGMASASPCKMQDGVYMQWGSGWDKQVDHNQFRPVPKASPEAGPRQSPSHSLFSVTRNG